MTIPFRSICSIWACFTVDPFFSQAWILNGYTTRTLLELRDASKVPVVLGAYAVASVREEERDLITPTNVDDGCSHSLTDPIEKWRLRFTMVLEVSFQGNSGKNLILPFRRSIRPQPL